MNKMMENMNEEEIANYCRSLSRGEEYDDIFNIINEKPEIINYFTAGELGRYIDRARIKEVDLKKIIKFKKNIEKVIFGEVD